MFEDERQQAEPPRRPSALRRAAVATALVAGVVAGGYGVAAAQADEIPSTTAPGDGTSSPDRGPSCDRGEDGTSGSTDSGSSSSSSCSAGATSL